MEENSRKTSSRNMLSPCRRSSMERRCGTKNVLFSIPHPLPTCLVLHSSSKNVEYALKRLVYECKLAAIKMCVEQAYDIRAGKGELLNISHILIIMNCRCLSHLRIKVKIGKKI